MNPILKIYKTKRKRMPWNWKIGDDDGSATGFPYATIEDALEGVKFSINPETLASIDGYTIEDEDGVVQDKRYL